VVQRLIGHWPTHAGTVNERTVCEEHDGACGHGKLLDLILRVVLDRLDPTRAAIVRLVTCPCSATARHTHIAAAAAVLSQKVSK